MYHMYSQQTSTKEVIAPKPHRFWVGMHTLEQPAHCNAKDLLLGLSKVKPGLGPDVKSFFGFRLVKFTKGKKKKKPSLVFQPEHQTLVKIYI